MHRKLRFAAVAGIYALASLAAIGVPSAANAQLAIPSAGSIPDVPGAADTPDPSRTYKLAFDMQSMGGASDVNSGLRSVASIINTLRAHGVPADQIEATAVFHGRTIVLVTKNEVYRNRTGAAENPNIALLQELSDAGVKFVICGVSARQQNYTAADLLPLASLNMSATMTFIDLQLKGYVKVDR